MTEIKNQNMKLSMLHKTNKNRYFHGTSLKQALKIINKGFNPTAPQHTLHGRESCYFSLDPIYAMSFMSSDELDFGILFEVDLDGYDLYLDPDIYAKTKGSIYVNTSIPPERIIGIYKFGAPSGWGVYEIDDNNNTKCLEVIKGSRFKVGDELKVPMGHRF